MPLPLVAIGWALVELTSAAITAYELYDLGKTLYDDIGDFDKNLSKAKEEVKKYVEALEKEIGADIDEKKERALLDTATRLDGKSQSEFTRKAIPRKGDDAGGLIEAAIKQNIPFRKIIGMVCQQANRVPAISLRRKKGVSVKDLPQAKKRILLEILRVGLEEVGGIEGIDDFIVVRMKQLMASLLFEFMDDILEWKSPLKAEVCFGPPQKFDDPLLNGGTRLLRTGSINPFYPLPHKQKGAIAADLAIPDYRKTPLKKDNLFAIIEIKFEGDSVKDKQFQSYDHLNKTAAKTKTNVTGKEKTRGKKGVTTGCRIALFRYPEDVATEPEKEKKPSEAHKKHSKPRGGQRIRG